MGERSRLLYRIEQSVRDKGIAIDELRDVPGLRSLFKGKAGPFELMGLDLLLTEILNATKADIILWMAPPTKTEKNPSKRRAWKTKCKLKRSEILELRSSGTKALEIAKRANVRVSRIYQILKEGEK